MRGNRQLDGKGKLDLDRRKSFFFCEGGEVLQRGFGMLILGDAQIWLDKMLCNQLWTCFEQQVTFDLEVPFNLHDSVILYFWNKEWSSDV